MIHLGMHWSRVRIWHTCRPNPEPKCGGSEGGARLHVLGVCTAWVGVVAVSVAVVAEMAEVEEAAAAVEAAEEAAAVEAEAAAAAVGAAAV